MDTARITSKVAGMRLTVRAKLLGTVGVVTVMLLLVAGVGYTQLQSTSIRAEALYQENTLGILYAQQTLANMIASAREEKSATLAAPGEARNGLIKKSRDEMDHALKAAKDYERTYASDEDRIQWEANVASVRKVIESRSHVLDLLANGNDDEAKKASAAMGADITAMNKALTDAAAFNEQLASDSFDALHAAAVRAQWTMVIATIVAVALGSGIVTMVDGLNDTLARTASTADRLNEARLQLQQAADQAAQATQEVARASQQVAEGTTQQATGTQQINQDVAELTSIITQVAPARRSRPTRSTTPPRSAPVSPAAPTRSPTARQQPPTAPARPRLPRTRARPWSSAPSMA